jgi:hypothetical protein
MRARTRIERALEIRRHLYAAQRLGFVVSQQEDDLIRHHAAAECPCVEHLATLHGEVLTPRGRQRVVRFLPCEVWRPESMCVCGQLTVDWSS